MLVLSRKSGEEIVVPQHEIVIRVLEIRGNKVRLGFTAPPQTNVYRQEVWARLQDFHPNREVASPPEQPIGPLAVERA